MLALITATAVLQTFSSLPNTITLPGGTMVYGALPGWTNGEYFLVSVTPFIAPSGQQITGEPSYSLNNGVVTQTYATQAAPAPTAYVSTTTLLSLLTLTEYKGIMQFAAADVASVVGTGQLEMWLDIARLNGRVNLDDPVTQSVAQYLITNNLLTSARAAVVFAPPAS